MAFLKAVHRWFDDSSIVEEIAQIFLIITVINSLMMVVGWDEPKEGSFAYVHLLGRLAIITIIVMIWEYEDILAFLKAWFHRGRREKGIEVWLYRMRLDSVSLVSVLFTVLVIILSIGSLLFQGLLEIEGGVRLYRNLLVLFVALMVGCFIFSRVSAFAKRENTD